MKRIIVCCVAIFTILHVKIHSSACEGYEMTIEDHYDTLVRYTPSYLVEKGKPENLYIPRKAIDNDINTAWVEGSEGDGIGEVFVIDLLPDVKSIKIMPGYAKNEKLFLENNRPKQLSFIIFNRGLNPKIKTEDDVRKLKVLCEWQHELKDSREFQEIVIPDYIKRDVLTLAIVIKSVYKGTKYPDTAIAEIRFFDERGVDLLKEMYDQHQIKHTPATKNKGGQK